MRPPQVNGASTKMPFLEHDRSNNSLSVYAASKRLMN